MVWQEGRSVNRRRRNSPNARISDRSHDGHELQTVRFVAIVRLDRIEEDSRMARAGTT
jgi:hypothetical protein